MEVITNKPKMSQLQTELTARALLGSIKAFYDNPENEVKFQKWLKSKKGDGNGTSNTND